MNMSMNININIGGFINDSGFISSSGSIRFAAGTSNTSRQKSGRHLYTRPESRGNDNGAGWSDNQSYPTVREPIYWDNDFYSVLNHLIFCIPLFRAWSL